MNQDFDNPMLARTGMTEHMGKLDECLKTHVDDVTANTFRRLAGELDQLPGELLRDLIFLKVHGLTHLELMAKHRRDLLQQQGLRMAQERSANV